MSSEKHVNLGLHKWAATDGVIRTEFNDNFGKIDEKVAEVSSQLADITTNKIGDLPDVNTVVKGDIATLLNNILKEAQLGKAAIKHAPVSGAKKIVFLGDSITQGVDLQSRAYVLWFNIMTNYQHTVWNKGIAGNTTAQMLARFDTDVLPNNPDYLFLNSGKNDLGGNRTAIDEQVKKDYRAIIRKAVLAGIKPIVSTVIPYGIRADGTDFSFTDKNRELTLEFNEWIKDFARKNAIPCVDFYSVFVDGRGWVKDEYIQTDNLHPSKKGTVILASELLSVFDKFKLSDISFDSSATNLVTNPLLLDSNNGLPNNFTINKDSGVLHTSSVIPHPIPGAGNLAKFTMNSPILANGMYKHQFNVTPGDKLVFSIDLLVEEVTTEGDTNNGVYVAMTDVSYAQSVSTIFYWKETFNNLYRFVSPTLTVPTGITSVRLDIGFARCTNGIMYIGRPQVKKVN
ncbi:GDSL-type esterase/lipase family protein [Peribacillus simplex]|uniref:GDSL-type esterase/lipase family protein n=1 Tax=Peribacillus simplex TaxID=1478 RepID=UPI0037F5EF1F